QVQQPPGINLCDPIRAHPNRSRIIWSLLAIILIASSRLMGSSFHREPPLIVSIILLVCLVLFYRLRITIDDETLCASFEPGIIRKRERLGESVGSGRFRTPVWYG